MKNTKRFSTAVLAVLVSATANLTTAHASLTAPSGVTAHSVSPANTLPNAAQEQVQWTDVSGAVAYEVDAYDSSGNKVAFNSVTSTSATSSILTGLTGGVSYNFYVWAIYTSEKDRSNAYQDTPTSVPGAPGTVTATASASKGLINVSWTAPTSNGGSPITGYTITGAISGSSSSSAAVTKSVAATVSSQDITGLTDGTTYKFQVVATNALGNSTSTSSSSATTPSLPGAPTGVSTTGATGGTVPLQWAAPASDGSSAITGYTVFVYDSSGNEIKSDELNVTTNSATLSNLTSGSYTVKVAATNAVGQGPLSAASTTIAVTTSSTLTANTPIFSPSTISSKSVGATISISATAPSGTAVALSVSPNTVCTYSSGQITTVGGGVCTVIATVAATSTYAAGSTQMTFNVTKNSQSINFNSIADQTEPSTLQLSAITTSGSQVTYSASGACSVTGATLTLNSVGVCTVTANSPETNGYLAASPVSQSFGVTAVVTSAGSGGGGSSSGGGGGAVVAPVVVVVVPAPTPSATPKPSESPTPTPSPSAKASVSPAQPQAPAAQPSKTPVVAPTPTPTPVAPAPTPTATAAAKLPAGSKTVAPGVAVVPVTPTTPVKVTAEAPVTSVAKAPAVAVTAGQVTSEQLTKLPAAAPMKITLSVGGSTVSLGTVKTDAKGNLKIPALSLAKPGTYTIAVKSAKGTTYFVKVVVKAKK